MAGKWAFLHRSEDYIYYYRRAIPNCIRHAFGNKWEIKRSLKTREKSVAILRHNALNVKVEMLFMQARVGGVVSKKDLSSMLATLEDRKSFLAEYEADPRRALWSGIASLLRGKPILDEHNHIVRPTPVSVEGDKLIDPKGNIVPAMEVSIALSIADKQDTQEIDADVEKELSAVKGFYFFEIKDGSMKPITPLPQEQANHIIQATAVQTPIQHIAPPVQQNAGDGNLVPLRFSLLIEDYMKSYRSLEERTKRANEAIFKVFMSFYGDVNTTEIDHRMMTGFFNKIQKLPSNAAKKYPNVPLKELIKRDIPESELMSPNNVNKYMNRLAQLFKYAVNHGHMEINYAKGKRVHVRKKDSKKEQKLPFTAQDLIDYFNAPIHAENKRDGKNQPMFWLPLIALYSGMRIEEIAQLRVSDVREVEDEHSGARAWCFDLNEEEDKNLKNAPSIRLVPVHTELVKMGFMDYYHERRRKGFQLLWDLTKPEGRNYSHNIERQLMRYLRKKGGITDSRKGFHSFRRTVIKVLRDNPMVKKEYREALVGHEMSGTSDQDYFSGLGIIPLKSTLEAIQYPKLDLSHLYQNL